MKISVPITQTLNFTTVVDNTDKFSNLSSDSIGIDKKFQESGSIYQNTTGAIIPVVTYVPADEYFADDLVFEDDGTGTDRVHKIRATDGEFPSQPEDYLVGPDTSFDETTWADRYMELTTFPVGASLNGEFKVLNYNNVYSFAYSADGLTVILAVQRNSGETHYYFKEHTLSTAFDPTTISDTETASYLISYLPKAISITTNDDALWLTEGTNVRLYMLSSTGALLSSVTYEGAKSIADTNITMTASPFHLTTSWERYFDVVKSTGAIQRWYMNPDWNIAGAVTSGSSYTLTQSASVGASLDSLCYNANGTVMYTIWINLYTYWIVEYSLSPAYDFSSATQTSAVSQGFDWERTGIQISPDGTQLFYIKGDYNYTSEQILTAQLFTPNDLDTYHYAVFPFYHTETRNSIVYTYKMESADSFGYIFTSTKNSVYANSGYLNPLTSLSDPSTEEKAYIASNGSWLPKTIYIRPTGVYIRTTTDAPVEYETLTSYSLELIESVDQIKGMTYIEPTLDRKPLDDKNYSKATAYGYMKYVINGQGSFDTIALGSVKGDSVTITFNKADGTSLTPIILPIDASRDLAGNLAPWSTTLIFYASETIVPDLTGETPVYGSVTVEITTTLPEGEIELATLMTGMSAEAGFTNLTMTNTFKDFSVFEYDVWGYASYLERAKVSSYSGTVDVEITDYDMTDRLMTSLGKQLIIINGSDLASCSCDSANIFASTQKIGRFLTWSQRTKVTANDISTLATYTFSFEEIV